MHWLTTLATIFFNILRKAILGTFIVSAFKYIIWNKKYGNSFVYAILICKNCWSGRGINIKHKQTADVVGPKNTADTRVQRNIQIACNIFC